MRDEIKRLRETELAIADDPLAREIESLSPVSGREKGKHNKGRALHRAVGDAEWREAARSAPLFQKPSLDNMGPGTDMATPAGAVSRSLFKKQSHDEAHGADYGLPDDGGRSMFRKNSLDEMTVRRTEKPVESVKPVNREKIGAGSYENPADDRQRKRRPGKTGRPGR